MATKPNLMTSPFVRSRMPKNVCSGFFGRCGGGDAPPPSPPPLEDAGAAEGGGAFASDAARGGGGGDGARRRDGGRARGAGTGRRIGRRDESVRRDEAGAVKWADGTQGINAEVAVVTAKEDGMVEEEEDSLRCAPMLEDVRGREQRQGGKVGLTTNGEVFDIATWDVGETQVWDWRS